MITWLNYGFLQKKMVKKVPHPLNPKFMELICNVFEINVFVMFTAK